MQVENIGARRLHTVLERLVEGISFEAPDKVAEVDEALPDPEADARAKARNLANPDGTVNLAAFKDSVMELFTKPLGEKLQRYADMQSYFYRHVIDKQDVRGKLQSLLQQDDLSKYIL